MVPSWQSICSSIGYSHVSRQLQYIIKRRNPGSSEVCLFHSERNDLQNVHTLEPGLLENYYLSPFHPQEITGIGVIGDE